MSQSTPLPLFEIVVRDGGARRGRLRTAHGDVETPAFMPVGTAGAVKAMLPREVRATGARMVLANAYHLMLRPGAECVAELGGLHRFSGWDGPILTDSGGFQVFSLARLRDIDEEGVVFRSHIDGSHWRVSPERSIGVQDMLGSDIAMAFDECIGLPAEPEHVRAAMERSVRWAERSRKAFAGGAGRALFGIQQGGTCRELRRTSIERLVEVGFDGYAVGGLAVGEAREEMFAVLDDAGQIFPSSRPRYLMGVGRPADMVGAVLRGMDLFDCVLPTRFGRNGRALTRRGEINLRNVRHRADPRPLDPDCMCPCCAGFSRAYLHHMTRAGEIGGAMLLSSHNLHWYQELMAQLRTAISDGNVECRAERLLEQLDEGDLEPWKRSGDVG